ncbi:TrbC/VirB2 family protein (plasmid) [Campylobacter fetus]|uniref:TrbC/VirB2 family protein n=1 Tax=Campylobacter fetus TaxID=196 RepID=A0A974MRG9_CAMFE|nr:TrbC/VirB2 family protein [Campylobacter fetus]QMS59911.1 TrbC/VirB2 family protein [Campylobacter fetus]
MERERERELLNDNFSQLKTSTYSLYQKSNFLNFVLVAFIASFVFVPEFAFGAGLDSAEKLLKQVSEWLNYLAAATVTVAILIVGYKVMFGGQTIRECTPIIIGTILIASASTIASLLLG